MNEGAFILSENLGKVITTCLLSMVPTFEGRYAVVTALAAGMPALPAFLLAVIASTLPMPFLLWLLRPILDWVLSWPIKPIRYLADRFITKAQEKAAKMRKGSLWALYLFVALPLPGTGVWTGSAIAVLLDIKRLPAACVILFGNITACGIMTLIATGAVSFLSFLL